MHEYEARIAFLESELARILGLLLQLQSQLGVGGYASSLPPTGEGSSLAVGIALENIAARPGAAGMVQLYQGDTWADAGRSVSAKCATSRVTAAGHGIDKDSWCVVETDIFGAILASPLDCT